MEEQKANRSSSGGGGAPGPSSEDGPSSEKEADRESGSATKEGPVIEYVTYRDETQLKLITDLVDRDLSEPYSIFTYRYFLHNWPNLSILAFVGDQLVGTIVSKAEKEHGMYRGYIAMLAVETSYRKCGIGKELVSQAVERMIALGCDEIMLETEVTNAAALRLYEKLGFAREERLLKYYLNGVDAFRLKLWLHGADEEEDREEEEEGEEGVGGGSGPPPPPPPEAPASEASASKPVEKVDIRDSVK